MATLRLGLSSVVLPIRYGALSFIVAFAVALSAPEASREACFLLMLPLTCAALLALNSRYNISGFRSSDTVLACAAIVCCPMISLVRLNVADTGSLEPVKEALTSLVLGTFGTVITYLTVTRHEIREPSIRREVYPANLLAVALTFAIIWSGCAVVVVNRFADTTPLQSSSVEVGGTRIVRTGLLDRYEIMATSRYPGAGPKWLRVSEAIYVPASQHRNICVRIYAGNLGLEWYQTVRCS